MPAVILSLYEQYVDRLKCDPIIINLNDLNYCIDDINIAVVEIVDGRHAIEQNF